MKNQSKKPYILSYDKFVYNGHGGCFVERVMLKADTKDIAMRRMKEDVYKHGSYGGYSVAFMPNGQKLDLKPRKAPVVTLSEKINSPVLSRKLHRDFGVDKPRYQITRDGLLKDFD